MIEGSRKVTTEWHDLTHAGAEGMLPSDAAILLFIIYRHRACPDANEFGELLSTSVKHNLFLWENKYRKCLKQGAQKNS
jgi:hypothetical protein